MLDKEYEEIKVNDLYVSRDRTITETDLVMFTYLTGDWHPLHTSETYTAQTVFGERIFHGTFALAISTGFYPMKTGVVKALYGWDTVKFRVPVKIHDSLHLEMTALEKVERPDDTGLITFENKMVNQRGEVAVVYNSRVLFNRNRNSSSFKSNLTN